MIDLVVAIPRTLSCKEEQVFKELLKGHQVTFIAKKLNRSLKTIHSHKYAIYRKLSIQNDFTFFRDLVIQGVVKLEKSVFRRQ